MTRPGGNSLIVLFLAAGAVVTGVPRVRHILLVLVLASLVCFGAPVRAQDAAPPAAPGDTTATQPAPVGTITVILEKGEQERALRIRRLGNGLVEITRPDGTRRNVSAAQIRAILDGRGQDRTSDVIERGLGVGVDEVPGSRAPIGGRPGRNRGAYPLVEVAMLSQLHSFDGGDPLANVYLAIDLGYATNVGERDALGGSVFVGGSASGGESRMDARHRLDLGLRLRGRRWLTQRMSLDFSPGLILGGTNDWSARPRFPSLALQAALNLTRTVGVEVQFLSTRRGTGQQEATETAWYAGARFGSTLGSALVIPTALVELVANAR